MPDLLGGDETVASPRAAKEEVSPGSETGGVAPPDAPQLHVAAACLVEPAAQGVAADQHRIPIRARSDVLEQDAVVTCRHPAPLSEDGRALERRPDSRGGGDADVVGPDREAET